MPEADGPSTGNSDGSIVVAIDEDFDDWDPIERGYLDTKPNASPSPFEDHATIVTIMGQECLFIHTVPEENSGYGVAVEFALDLDQRTDMSRLDFLISFDVFLPEDRQLVLQFGLDETTNHTSIYSDWSDEINLRQWQTFIVPIDFLSISYSEFVDNPGDWIFDQVRLKIILPEETPLATAPLSFCVDNIVVTNDPDAF